MSVTFQFEEVWAPIPNSSQEIAIDTRCHQTLYTGTRGPGKTDTQLMRFRSRVGIGYGAHWRGIIFDREYKNLDDLIVKSKKWFPKFDDGAKYLSGKDNLKWIWPTGEELLFRQVKEFQDYWKYHGHEYPFIGWNELTKYPTSDLYDAMMSVNRTSFRSQDHPIYVDRAIYEEQGVQVMVSKHDPNALEIFLPEIQLEVFSTTNPYGAGHNWVKSRFIDPAPYGQVIETVTEIFNPRTQQEEEVVSTQVAIFGHWRENIYLTPQYLAGLKNETDESRRAAWFNGDWNILAGGALSDLWTPSIHILPRFVPPASWPIDRAFDWGSTHPFSVGWFAEANGEEATIYYQGEEFAFNPPPGTLIQLNEWYGTKQIGTNKGLKLSAPDIARGIKTREELMIHDKWIKSRVYPGPADNQIRDVVQSDVDTIESKMMKEGVVWTKSDKSPGSRRNGLQLIRDRLHASLTGEGPGLYFMDNCRASISTLPTLPRSEKQPDDVDTDAEDHPYDMVRYRVLAAGAKKAPQNMKVTFVQ